jgi:flavin-dependent dehydrogenase
MPDSLAVLRQLGITLPPGVGHPFRGIRFIRGLSQVTAPFPSGSGIGVRRSVLHGLLAGRASELGVHCAWGERAMLGPNGSLQLRHHTLKADVIIAADGQNSPARRQSPLAAVARESKRYGFRRHYRMPPWSPYMELYWGRDCQVYITPVAADEVCVASLARDPELRLQQALAQFPDLVRRIGDAEQVTPDRGALSVTRRLQRVCTWDFALVGDASGSVDAVTGEGLCLGFRQALALAEAIHKGDLSAYRSAHKSLSLRPRIMSQMLLLLDRHPAFQRRALAGLASHPEVFNSLLAVHVGDRSFLDLVSWNLVHLCRAFLTA